jgi:hypothetical protein
VPQSRPSPRNSLDQGRHMQGLGYFPSDP